MALVAGRSVDTDLPLSLKLELRFLLRPMARSERSFIATPVAREEKATSRS
jgi:hypothetical protein